MRIIAELTIIPIGIGTSFSEYIAKCEQILRKTKDLKIQLHAEGTNIEGEFDKVMEAIKQCIKAMHEMGVPRLITNVHFSSRIDKTETMEDKVKSVETRL